ncbi:MAG: hypothetical protein K2L82_11155 [Lachnospiraceae bacterium]|nr:hypothetical protein [Lachnospiraceae bacterium]
MITTKDKKVCFVITPIGDNNSDIRRHIDGIIDQAIEPALGEKYDIEVAHRKYEIGSINDRVIRSVLDSDLVIANLTNTNPNVMYELAVRYSFGKPAIVIAEKGTKLPFDVIDENTIFYVNDPAGANELKQQIIEYEKGIDLGKKTYGPIYKVINRIPLYDEVESGKNVPSEKLMQYVIDRLDSIEKNLSAKPQNENDGFYNHYYKQRLSFEFKKNNSFELSERDELIDVFINYRHEGLVTTMDEDTIVVSIVIYSMDYVDLINDIDKWIVSKKNISYQLKDRMPI